MIWIETLISYVGATLLQKMWDKWLAIKGAPAEENIVARSLTFIGCVVIMELIMYSVEGFVGILR